MMNFCPYRCFPILLILTFAIGVPAQRSDEGAKGDPLPKEVRGYKVDRAQVGIKKAKESGTQKPDKKSEKRKSEKEEYEEDEPLLIRLGQPQLVSVGPLGVTFDVPVILAAVKQQGDIDRLVFEAMKVNDTSVTIDDYVYPFKLPNKEPLILSPPVRIFVSSPQVVFRTIDEFLNSKEAWPVSGRVYVCGHFQKFVLKFKRAIPVELQASIKNPLN